MPLAGRGGASRRRLSRWPVVPEEEDQLAGSDHPEFFTGHVLDCARVFTQASRLVAQQCVFVTQPISLGCQPVGQAARIERIEEPALADEGVRHEHAGDEKQQQLSDTAEAG